MIRRFIIEAEDSLKGYDEGIDKLVREWGAEEIEPCEDAVSRETMWKIIHELEEHDSPTWVWREMLAHLPSVQPIEKIAKWIEKYESEEWYGSLIECSECGFEMIDIEEANYCPNCGAKMDGGGWNIS